MNHFKTASRLISLLGTLFLSSFSLFAQQKWYDPMQCDTPYISGRAWNVEIGRKSYHRIPDRLESTLPKAVWGLSHHTAGLSVRFLTNSKNIEVKYVLANKIYSYLNMAVLNHSGIDLYATDANGGSHWIGSHMNWSVPSQAGDTIVFRFPDISIPSFPDRGLMYDVYLPPYNEVTYMSIGVDQGASFQFINDSGERPIVIYGSSIVQGASPSRPGLMWTTILKRRLECPVVNMGFSGSALLEPSVFDMLSEIDARVFVLDPIPNSHNMGDEITKRTIAGVRKLREKTEAPILLVENYNSPDSVYRRPMYDNYRFANQKYHEAYEQLLQEGVKNLYYLYDYEINFSEDAMIESTHPNDIGNMEYADALEKKIRQILSEDTPDPLFPPTTQFRDGSYLWMERHHDVILRNHTVDPQILFLGNSITQYWGGEPVSKSNGPKSWQKLFGKYRVTNMGFGWDCIENLYWRIFHGELEGCTPQHIFLSIGINNVGQDVQKTATGIINIAQLIRKRQPQARLHVIKIYPAKNMEAWINQVNALVQQQLPLDDMTDLVDCTSVLSGEDGLTDQSCYLEGLHPNERGYSRIAKVLEKELK